MSDNYWSKGLEKIPGDQAIDQTRWAYWIFSSKSVEHCAIGPYNQWEGREPVIRKRTAHLWQFVQVKSAIFKYFLKITIKSLEVCLYSSTEARNNSVVQLVAVDLVTVVQVKNVDKPAAPVLLWETDTVL